MLTEFYEYWEEHGDTDKKMKFEKVKSFSVKSRLNRWSKNNFSNNSKKEPTIKKSTGFLNPGEVPDDVLVMGDQYEPQQNRTNCQNLMSGWMLERGVIPNLPDEQRVLLAFKKLKDEEPKLYEIYERTIEETKQSGYFSASEVRAGFEYCSKLENK